MGEGGFRFTAFSQLKIVSCEARFVVCGSGVCLWFALLRFLARPGASGSGAGAGRGGGEGLPATFLPPQMPSLGMALEQGIWNDESFLSPLLNFFFSFFLVKLRKKSFRCFPKAAYK